MLLDGSRWLRLSWLSSTVQAQLPRDGTTHRVLGPPTAVISQGSLSQTWLQASLIEAVLHQRLRLVGESRLCQIDNKTQDKACI